jgi:DNA-directed RNA polymerase-3 subunit RPC5
MSSSAPRSIEDDDPIVHTYSVFIKPPLPAQRKLLVLQHPNTQSDYPDTLQAPPFTDLRLKTGSGMVEADVPLDYNTAYDRHKGIVWGTALQKSAAAKTSLGLSGGFGVGGAPARTRARGAAGDEVEGGDFNEAVRTDRVLRKQTLGGLSTEPKDARYLVAVFQGSKSDPCLCSNLTATMLTTSYNRKRPPHTCLLSSTSPTTTAPHRCGGRSRTHCPSNQ